MRNASNQENHERRLARRIRTRSNPKTLHLGFLHPLVHVRRMNGSRLLYLLRAETVHRKCFSAGGQPRALRFIQQSSRHFCPAWYDPRANPLQHGRQLCPRLARINNQQHGRFPRMIDARAYSDRAHIGIGQ